MWQVTVFCSSCAEERDVVVESLDDVVREVCACGYSFHAETGELIELRRRREHLHLAA